MSKYFQGLNYSLANEDTWVEYHLAPQNARSIFTVCGSGSRVTPLLAKNPEELHVVDLSDIQLMMFRLRVAAARNLTHAEYLYFLGYTKASPSNTPRAMTIARLGLSESDLKHWRAQESTWKDEGFIYLGRWESHFMKLGRIFRKVSMSNLWPIFEARNMQEQKEAIDKYWKDNFFKYYTKVVMNEWVANKFLYKGHFAGGKSNKTMQLSAAEFVYREFSDLFANTWVRSNYFMQMIFLNRVAFPEAFPAECNEGVFEGIKSARSRIHFHQENLLNLMKHTPHDFYSLSDTFSYMSNDDVRTFLADLPKEVPAGTHMVIRTFMRKPSFEVSAPWVTDQRQNQDLARKDCTRMYEFTNLTKK